MLNEHGAESEIKKCDKVSELSFNGVDQLIHSFL